MVYGQSASHVIIAVLQILLPRKPPFSLIGQKEDQAWGYVCLSTHLYFNLERGAIFWN